MTEFIGFSSRNDRFEILKNKELALDNLITQLNVEKGECDWNPAYGSGMRSRMFSMKTETEKSEILADIKAAFSDNGFNVLDGTIDEIEKGWIFNFIIQYGNYAQEVFTFTADKTTNKIYSNGLYDLKEGV